MSNKTHVLYRFYSATGQLLYVGITMNPPQRFKSHRDSKEWWPTVSGITVENYSSRDELAQAERRAIQVEHPLHNVVHAKATPAIRAANPAPVDPSAPVNDVVAELFSPSPPLRGISSLFSGPRYQETRYGYVTDEEFERRAAIDRAKDQARRDCQLCDPTGYRNGYLCHHIDNPTPRRDAQKKSLQVIQGGE